MYLAEASPLELWPPSYPTGWSSGSTRSPGATGSRPSRTRTCSCSGASARRCCATRVPRSRTCCPTRCARCCSPRARPRQTSQKGSGAARSSCSPSARPAAIPFEQLRSQLDAVAGELVEAIMEAMRDLGLACACPAGARAGRGGAAAGERAGALAVERQPEVATLLHAVVRIDDAAGQSCCGCSTAPARATRSASDLAAAGGPSSRRSSSTPTCARWASSACCTSRRRKHSLRRGALRAWRDASARAEIGVRRAGRTLRPPPNPCGSGLLA